MASLMPQGKQQYWDANGNPLAGGRVYTYASGTDTPLATYTTAAGNVENTNPVVLNARGEASIFWGPVAYKVILKDASELEIWTQDGVYPQATSLDLSAVRSDLASAASGKGASLIGIQDAGNYYSGATVEAALQEAGADLVSVREKLTAARTYYVRTDGSDSNNGLSNTAGGAFLTIQKAVNVAQRSIDFNGFDVTINVGDGTRTAGAIISGLHTGDGNLYIIGNVATPSNCVINATGADCFYANTGAAVWIRGFKFTTTTSGACLAAYTGAQINTQSCDFGSCAASHFEVGSGGVISADGAYTISGGGVSHWHAGSFGLISTGQFTIAISNTPAFSSYFAGCAQGTIVCGGATFTGSATGTRFLAHKGGVIDTTQSETSLPGNAAGRTATGGVYRGGEPTPFYLRPDNGSTYEIQIQGLNFNAQTFTTFFKTVNDLTTSKGYFFTNGDDCYSSGRTHFAGTSNVDVTTGTTDGWSFKNVGFGALFHASANGGAAGYLRRRTSNGDVLGFFRDTASVGSISVTTTATAYNTSSDYRLKDDVADLTESGPFIDALRPRSWTWKADGSKGAGFIAHELQEVSPSSVTGEKDGKEMQSVHYSSSELVAHLVAEVQSLRKRVESLERSCK